MSHLRKNCLTMLGCCLLLAMGLAGCGSERKSYQTAPVSGRVTLDGKPLPDAIVKFTPVRSGESARTGPEAIGTTDADGRYTLVSAFDDRGAVVGMNQIMISTLKTETDPKDMDKVNVLAKECVPAKYSTSPLSFDVKPEGTEAANFDLTSN